MNLKRNDIEEHLLLQYLLGNVNDEDRKNIEAWLDESETNRLHLDRMERVWLETGKIDPAPVAVDIDAAWERISKRVNSTEKERTVQSFSTPFFSGWIRYTLTSAATVIILIGLYSLYTLILKPVKQLELGSAGKILVDTLPDGSFVSLNKNSKLIYPIKFKEKSREVKLSGEALFNVKHDANQPFIVDVGKAKVKVLGTTFRIKGYPDSTVEVNVIKGKVLFFTVNKTAGDTSSIILATGIKGVLTLNSFTPVIVENTNHDDLFWFDRTLEFRTTPLTKVFELLEKYYPITIRVSDERIRNCLLTATFANDPPDQILRIIAESFNLTLSVDHQIYLLTGNGCNE